MPLTGLTTLATTLGYIEPKDLLFRLLAVAAFGIVGIILVLLGFKLFDWCLPKVDVEKELCEKNIAVAIVMAAVILGVSMVIVVSIL